MRSISLPEKTSGISMTVAVVLSDGIAMPRGCGSMAPPGDVPTGVFVADELPALKPVPEAVFDIPVWTQPKVAPDRHAEVAKALFSLPEQWIGTTLDVRADSELVKFYRRGTLVKVHPRQPPGGRSTDREDLPEHKAGYALRDLAALIATCAAHGPNIGIYAERILDDPLPWTRMRTVYRLQGLVRRYGADRVEQACSLSLDLDVVSVNKIVSMLERATENTTPALPQAVGQTATRFSRDPSEFSTTPTSLTVVPITDSEETC
ncbi:Mu transposase domain-containing protein [Mycolicibacterium celeriflavum]|uniref:Mu transposase domain-containing protein n=1 Tax=Mycolicibacterium celeriflavum TaxID=1249101 RepID=UPI003898EFBF